MDSGAQAFWLSSRFQVICPKAGGPHPLSLQSLRRAGSWVPWSPSERVIRDQVGLGPGPAQVRGGRNPVLALTLPTRPCRPPMGVSNCGPHPLLKEHPLYVPHLRPGALGQVRE